MSFSIRILKVDTIKFFSLHQSVETSGGLGTYSFIGESLYITPNVPGRIVLGAASHGRNLYPGDGLAVGKPKTK